MKCQKSLGLILWGPCISIQNFNTSNCCWHISNWTKAVDWLKLPSIEPTYGSCRHMPVILCKNCKGVLWMCSIDVQIVTIIFINERNNKQLPPNNTCTVYLIWIYWNVFTVSPMKLCTWIFFWEVVHSACFLSGLLHAGAHFSDMHHKLNYFNIHK